MSQLDTRIPLQVPNVLAQGAQIAQTSAADQATRNALAQQVRQDQMQPLRMNALAAQTGMQSLEQTRAEQQMLGQVLDDLANLPKEQLQGAWAGRARPFLVQNGIFEEGELPEQWSNELGDRLAVGTLMPAEELTDMQRYAGWMQNGTPEQQKAARIHFGLDASANKSGTTVNLNTAATVPEYSKLPPGVVYRRNPDNSIMHSPDGLPMTATLPNTKADADAAAADREAADAASQSQAAVSKASDTIATIDGLMNHPGFDRLYGAFDTRFGRIPIPDEWVPNVPGGDAANAEAYLSQIEGQSFLQAFESLKGGGQITEVEGKKATEAISRATNRGQSPEAAREALEELRAIAERGAEREIRKQNPELEFDGVKIMNGMVFISRNGQWFQKQ